MVKVAEFKVEKKSALTEDREKRMKKALRIWTGQVESKTKPGKARNTPDDKKAEIVKSKIVEHKK